MQGQLLILSRDLEFTNLLLRLKNIVTVLQGILMTNVAVLITKVLISKYRLLNRYLIIISVVSKISYGNKKYIGRYNLLIYSLNCME